jgi:hypothetical protein
MSSDRELPRVNAAVAWDDDPTALARAAGKEVRSRPVPVSDLDRLLLALEAVDWRRVPGVSVPTAAMFATLVRDAREEATGRREAGESA